MDWLVELIRALPAEELRLDLLVKLALATFLGGAIGWEREASGKPAGLRTNILICVGATLLTDLSVGFAELTAPAVGAPDVVRADPARIAAQIVSGIGFLGAGTIMQARGSVSGLTTAATLWVVAAIGMSVGAGAFLEAAGTALLVLVILMPLGRVENRIERRRQGRQVRLVVLDRPGIVEDAHQALERHELIVKVESVERDLEAGRRTVLMDVRGASEGFRAAREELLSWSEVLVVQRD